MAELLSGTKRTLNVGITSYSENTTTLSVVGISSLDDVVINGSVSVGGTTGVAGQYFQSTGDGVEWVSPTLLRDESNYVATSGQTTFTKLYSVGLLDVYVNGVKLHYSDYTASNGTSIILNEPLFAGDFVDIIAYATYGTVSALDLESDTLDSVTSRNNSTTNNISVGILTATSVYSDVIRRKTDNSTNTKISLDAGTLKFYAGNGITPKISINGGVGVSTNLNVVGIATVGGDLVVKGDIKSNSFYYARRTSSSSVSFSGYTTIPYGNVEEDYGDTDAMWDSSTSRFTPTVAGVWQFNASASVNGGSSGSAITVLRIEKNGSPKSQVYTYSFLIGQASTMLYMNGTTDYIQVKAYGTSGTRTQTTSGSFFEALLLKQPE